MRYTTWVEKVFKAFVTAADGNYDFSLTKVAEVLGCSGFDWEAFAKHEPRCAHTDVIAPPSADHDPCRCGVAA